MQTQELDTFDNGQVHELPVGGSHDPLAVSTGGDSDLDTFDNMEPVEIPKDNKSGDEGKGFSDKQTDQLDEEEDKKEEEKEEKKEEDKEPETKQEEEPKKEEPKQPKGKTIRVKGEDGEAKDIELDSTVKIKVDGKNEIVSIKELRDNYSGKVAWENKFSEIQEEKRTLESEIKDYKQDKEQIVGHLTEISKMLDDQEKNPLDVLHYLVDMTGRDPLDYSKKVMSFLAEEVRNLDSMDDVERDLYWKNKELDAIRNNQAAKEERESKLSAQREKAQKLNQLRESQGVTEEEFVKSHSELKSLGYSEDEITPEAIVKYAVMKPKFEIAENLVKDYEDDLSDDQIEQLISTVADTLKIYPRISQQKALEVSIEQLGWEYEMEEDFKELNEKAGPQPKESKKSFGSYRYGQKPSNDDHVESFDDFNY